MKLVSYMQIRRFIIGNFHFSPCLFLYFIIHSSKFSFCNVIGWWDLEAEIEFRLTKVKPTPLESILMTLKWISLTLERVDGVKSQYLSAINKFGEAAYVWSTRIWKETPKCLWGIWVLPKRKFSIMPGIFQREWSRKPRRNQESSDLKIFICLRLCFQKQ